MSKTKTEQKDEKAELEKMNVIIRYSSKFENRTATYLNLFLFWERSLNLLLPIAVISFYRTFQVSAKYIKRYYVSRFIKRCGALNFELFIKSNFEYSCYFKILKTFFLIFWPLMILDIFEYLLEGINIQWTVVYFFDVGDKVIVL